MTVVWTLTLPKKVYVISHVRGRGRGPWAAPGNVPTLGSLLGRTTGQGLSDHAVPVGADANASATESAAAASQVELSAAGVPQPDAAAGVPQSEAEAAVGVLEAKRPNLFLALLRAESERLEGGSIVMRLSPAPRGSSGWRRFRG